KMPCAEIATPYYARPEGSASKLSTYSDGWRILRTILKLYRIERPMWFFGAIAGLFAGLALLLAAPLIFTYLETHQVPRFPVAIAAGQREQRKAGGDRPDERPLHEPGVDHGVLPETDQHQQDRGVGGEEGDGALAHDGRGRTQHVAGAP